MGPSWSIICQTPHIDTRIEMSLDSLFIVNLSKKNIYHFKKKSLQLKLLNARKLLRHYITNRRQHSRRYHLQNSI